MEELQVKIIFNQVFEFNPNLTIYPGWWMKLWIQVEEDMEQYYPNQEQWHSLKNIIMKLLKIWQKKYTKWEVTSSTMLISKLELVPGDMLAMSFPSEMINKLIELYRCYNLLEELDQTECLDFQSIKDTSTLSMTVPGQITPVDVNSGNKLSLSEELSQIVKKSNPCGSLQSQIGMMSSSISLSENGELKTYGLEEPVGPNRITLNWYDGKKSLEYGKKWYEAKIAGLTMSVNKPQIRGRIDQLIKELVKDFMKKNPKRLQTNSPTYGKRRRN